MLSTDYAHIRRANLAELDGIVVQDGTMLNLVDPTLPSSWTISQPGEKMPVAFNTLAPKLCVPSYVDVGFTETGERLYVSLKEAASKVIGLQQSTAGDEISSPRLQLFSEAKIKSLHAIPQLLLSSYNYNISVGFSWRDYTIIEELGVGVNKFLLSNESVLQAPPANASLRPAEIFNNITLIANCHKKESTHHSGRGYTVEAKRVIFYPVHNLLRANMKDTADVIKTFTEFNEAIWEALKEGNVFVHCLAGVHRAACVAVSHYLWRYYKLGHKHLSADVPAIYESLASRRPGVVALSYLSLVRVWEEHLRKQTQQ